MWVQVTDGFVKLRTVDVDVGDLVFLEKGLDDLSRVVGNRSGGRLGDDIVTGPTTGFLVSPSSNDVYRRNADLDIPVSKTPRHDGY